MGVNISVRRVTGRTIEETWGVHTVYYETEVQDWFDSLRYGGDRHFILDNDFYYLDNDIPVGEQRLARPVDFNKTRKWVKAFVLKGNAKRLLEALDKMENDENLCFTWSW